MRLTFLETLNIHNFMKIMNDPMLHDPKWPLIPMKLPSNIPKFEGKDGEYPTNHVMMFQL